MKVGVVLPVYHQKPAYLYECLQAMDKQTYTNFKLVIVIDGANQQTVNATYRAAKQLRCSHKIIHRKENKGIAYSLNEGFSHLKDCPYLTWISSDNRQHPQFLNRLVKAMENAPSNTALVYSLYWPINEQGKRLEPLDGWFASMKKLMNRGKEEILSTCFVGASFLFTRTAFEQAGGYDPKYGVVSDYEFWVRLKDYGEFKFLAMPLMEYRLNGEHSLTTLTPREELYLQSMKASLDYRKKNNMIPVVTVIITAHNHEHYIEQCVESVLSQTFPHFNIVLLDVGSTDATLNKIHNWHDNRIIPIHIEKRMKPEALNIGLQYALGQYVLELDGDDWLDPQTLEIMVNEMATQPEDVGLVYANRKLWYDTENGLKEGPVVPGIPYANKYEVLSTMQTHCPRLFRKNALEAVNGWETAIRGETLDVDDYFMFLKLAEKYKLHWINAALYHQRRHQSNLTIQKKDQLKHQFQLIVFEMLERWGNEFTPQFEESDGIITKVNLIRN
ncbi:glycosyltransferase family 2 protein [Alkalihalobacterium bogoriense]|uniref:glycosyltransferase family 2 protein n=1 Tax=Alkalihalobacterium bogoriense TaxID=246272 RepID=UPI00047BA69E|nr:glycosyltransferase [Alkalihalobacterium bogoriense]